MAQDLTESGKSLIQEHPYMVAGGALVVVLIVWYLVGSGSSSSAAVAPSNNTSADAAALAAAQDASNAQIAQAQIAAGVTNNQTAAAQAVSLAQMQAQTDQVVAAATALGQQAQYNAAAEIAGSNASVAIASTQAQSAEQLSNNATLQSEFSSLAGVLNGYTTVAGAGGGAFANVANTASQSGSSSYSQSGSPAETWTGGFGDTFWSVPISLGTPATSQSASQSSSYSTVTANPNLPGVNSTFSNAFASLMAGLGKGVSAPVTQSLAPTNVLSLAQINSQAVNSTFNAA
jgi:hypothetical protein